MILIETNTDNDCLKWEEQRILSLTKKTATEDTVLSETLCPYATPVNGRIRIPIKRKGAQSSSSLCTLLPTTCFFILPVIINRHKVIIPQRVSTRVGANCSCPQIFLVGGLGGLVVGHGTRTTQRKKLGNYWNWNWNWNRRTHQYFERWRREELVIVVYFNSLTYKWWFDRWTKHKLSQGSGSGSGSACSDFLIAWS